MCVKLFLENLNFGPYSPYSTNTYIYKITITPKVYGDYENSIIPAIIIFLDVGRLVCIKVFNFVLKY